MTLTKSGRDREARRFAIRHLGKLRAAMQKVAPPSNSGWRSDYAVGFVTSHVAIGMLAAGKRLEFADTLQSWPAGEDILALASDLVPAQMSFQPLAFRRTLAEAWPHWPVTNEKWKEGLPQPRANTPFATGALHADRILRSTMAPGPAFIVDDWMRGIYAIEKEFYRDPRRNPLTRWIWRDPSRLYRYLVFRTLGEASFGINRERARRLTFEKQH